MSNFTTVGGAWKNKSVKGTEYIGLKFDKDILDKVELADIPTKICLFKNKYKNKDSQPDYVISAPVKENYQPKQ